MVVFDLLLQDISRDSNLNKLQSTVEVLDPLIKNNRACDPISIPRQLTLQSMTPINKTHISRRRGKSTTSLSPTTWNLKRLSRIDQIRIADVVVSRNLLERAVKARRNAAEGIALLDGNRRGRAVIAAGGPAEASSVVLKELVEGDGGVLVVAVLAAAGGVEDVVAMGVESDVSR